MLICVSGGERERGMREREKEREREKDRDKEREIMDEDIMEKREGEKEDVQIEAIQEKDCETTCLQ